MNKKTLLLLLFLLVVTLLFAVACGNTAPSTTTNSTTTAPVSSSTTTPITTATITTGTTTTTATVTTAETTTLQVSATTPPVTTQTPKPEAAPVKLMTFNLRYDTKSHECLALNVRGPHLLEIIKKYTPDSISFNDATHDWMNYLRPEMAKIGYSSVGVGRDWGKTGSDLSGNGNEHTPIFYLTEKYELLESHTFWLSDSPESKGSSSWDPACKRICTYAVLKNKETGSIYAHFGTHLDHQSEEARQNGLIVIESYIRTVLEKYGEIGIVLSGDFNTSNTSTTYKMTTSFMDDSYAIAKKKLVIGATTNGYTNPAEWETTYAGTNTPTVNTQKSPIDYIFLGKNTSSVSLYTILNDLFTFTYNGKTWTDHPVSDHYGVYCEASFTNPTSSLNYSETKLVSYKTTVTPSQSLLPEFESMTKLNDSFSVVSSLDMTKPLTNLLKENNLTAAARVIGSTHGVWELALTSNEAHKIAGLSITTGSSESTLPSIVRIYISSDGENWYRVGKLLADEFETSTTYYIQTKPAILNVKHVKIIISNCVNGVELANVTVYGQ